MIPFRKLASERENGMYLTLLVLITLLCLIDIIIYYNKGKKYIKNLGKKSKLKYRTMMVRGAIYMRLTKMTQMIPTKEDLLLCVWNNSNVHVATIPTNTISPTSHSPTFTCTIDQFNKTNSE